VNTSLNNNMSAGAEGLGVSWEGLRRTEKGRAAADLIISKNGASVKYNVYLRGEVVLHFASTDRGRAELAARLLRLAGVRAEAKREGNRGVWYVVATTDRLAAGRKELRKIIAEIVVAAVEKGWTNARRAERWLKKLERGRTLKKGWPKYHVGLARGGALVTIFSSPNSNSIKREARRLRKLGLEEGKHFTARMPEGGTAGYILILREGLVRVAKLSVRGEEKQKKSATEFIEYILQRAEEEGEEIHRKVEEVVEEGRARGSLTLKDIEKTVDGHYVRVMGGGAEVVEGWSGKKRLRLKIAAEVDGVKREYTITFSRYGRNNSITGFAVARVNAPGGREADAERFSALIEALTGRRPKVYRKSGGKITIVCYESHLEGFMRYAELADAVERWLEETSRRHASPPPPSTVPTGPS
jgi:hypothetical protein